MSEPVKVAEQAKLDAGKHWEGLVINGEFRLREYLGGSDHSAVFLTDLYDRDSHTAAIKIVAADSASGHALLDSCEQAASLSHPNLIHVLTAGRTQIDGANVVYVVMEYAEENLAQVISQRPLASDEAREMLKPTLQALSYLHAKGLAHARLKPANILATGDQLKVSGDSICRAGDSLTGLTVYDAPEGIASPVADSWSLGMALVEVLTQRVLEWNRASGEELVVPESLPEPLGEVVRNCLRRDPKLRWTATAIANHLDPSGAQCVAEPAATVDSSSGKPQTAFEVALEAARASYEPPVTPRKRSASVYLIPAVLFCAALAGLVLWFTRDSGSKLSSEPPVAASTPAPAAEPVKLLPPVAVAHPAPIQPAAAPRKPATPTKKATLSAPEPSESASTEKPADSTAAVINSPDSPAGNSPEGVVREVLPKVSQKALETIRGSVRVSVRVDVDSSGTVKYAKLDSPGPSQYFANQALNAAHEWKFAATGHPTQQTVHFLFTSSGVNASLSAE